MAIFVLVFFYLLPIAFFCDFLFSIYCLLFNRTLISGAPVVWGINFVIMLGLVVFTPKFLFEVPMEFLRKFGGPTLVVQLPDDFNDKKLTLLGDWAESKGDQVLEVYYDQDSKSFTRFKVYFPKSASLEFARKIKFFHKGSRVHFSQSAGSMGPDGISITLTTSYNFDKH